MTAPARFTQSDIARAMKGARAAGYARIRVGIDPTGNIVIDASNDDAPIVRRSSLDRLLDGAKA